MKNVTPVGNQTMKKLIRFGVSLDQRQIEDFDALIARKQYATRSEAIRDLIRDNLVKQA